MEFEAIAQYDYQADNDSELSLVANEKYLISETNESGWWHGSDSKGVSGWAPSNYLEKAPEKEPEEPFTPEILVGDATPSEVKSIEKPCEICKKEIFESFVVAKSSYFHVDCFKCKGCSSQLAGQGYVLKENGYYCEKCYHETYSPRCAKCNEICTGPYVTAMDRTWHPEHFVCTECTAQFEGDKFRSYDDLPYCENCYTSNYSPRCTKCKDLILEKVYSAGENRYHEKCFVCNSDGAPIGEEEPFHVRGDDLYCVTHYKEKFDHKCYRCGEQVGTKYVSVKENYYHAGCFTCIECNKSLSDGDFRPLGSDYCCPRCGDGPPIEQLKVSPPTIPINQAGGLPAALSHSPLLPTVIQPDPETEKVTTENTLRQRIEAPPSVQPGEEFFTYDELVNISNLPNGVDPTKREMYLNESEFSRIFDMTKPEYTDLPNWKKNALKRNVKLF